MADLLEHHAPLSGEPLGERMAALQKAAIWGIQHPADLSQIAHLHLDFWLHFQPLKISPHTFVYKTGAASAPYIALTINESGLFYQDVSEGIESPAAEPDTQLFSEFWFYGPNRPIPDLALRQKLVERMKTAFDDPGCPAATAHFELFEYPKTSAEGLRWEEGNHHRTDFIEVSGIGIEMGYWTWRDPPGKPGFLSFEQFLHLPPQALGWISPHIRARIEQYLGKTLKSGAAEAPGSTPKTLTSRDKMELAESLLQKDPSAEAGADALIALLAYEAESDYWRGYVFNRLAKLRDNPRVQHFILECLQGDSEIRFKKAVDVLSAWGFLFGDTLLANRNLILRLNWDDACAHDPDFREALEQVSKIVLRQ